MTELIQAWPLTSVAIAFIVGEIIGMTALVLIFGVHTPSHDDDDQVIDFTTRRGPR